MRTRAFDTYTPSYHVRRFGICESERVFVFQAPLVSEWATWVKETRRLNIDQAFVDRFAVDNTTLFEEQETGDSTKASKLEAKME